MTTPAPNAYCILHGTKGSSNFFIEGPFPTKEEAEANAKKDQETTNIFAEVVELVNPLNC